MRIEQRELKEENLWTLFNLFFTFLFVPFIRIRTQFCFRRKKKQLTSVCGRRATEKNTKTLWHDGSRLIYGQLVLFFSRVRIVLLHVFQRRFLKWLSPNSIGIQWHVHFLENSVREITTRLNISERDHGHWETKLGTWYFKFNLMTAWLTNDSF